ncbi:hypothetical protein BMONG18_1150 [Bifidobacterium mongoliense]|uniref:Uncharacterized protein n=1 Tax=Bifidobacterium mongoliense TaxID=518643 RepID=A0A423UD52_9BIFI|nr:hypothetical protein BMONG18_1150 [Bifidobacterium mongoliense]
MMVLMGVSLSWQRDVDGRAAPEVRRRESLRRRGSATGYNQRVWARRCPERASFRIVTVSGRPKGAAAESE